MLARSANLGIFDDIPVSNLLFFVINLRDQSIDPSIDRTENHWKQISLSSHLFRVTD